MPTSTCNSTAPPFPLSLSVGTACQASCPYCRVPEYPAAIATAEALIETCCLFIAELAPYFQTFTVRITGGEVGLVPNLSQFICWLNREPAVLQAKIYSNGALLDHEGLDLQAKCHVYEHYIHHLDGERVMRFVGGEEEEVSLIAIAARMEASARRCRTYRMVAVDSPSAAPLSIRRLRCLGVKIAGRTGPGEQVHDSDALNTAFCFHSKYLYVFDVANRCFFHCCEVKDPKQGRRHQSIIDFLAEGPDALYAQCSHCRTYEDIRTHANAAAMDWLTGRHAKGGGHGLRHRSP